MNWSTILSHLDLLVEGAIDIPRFRKLIVVLALRGKLVAQEKSREIQEEIEKSVNDLVKSHMAKRSKQKFSNLTFEDVPFALGDQCRFERLGEVATIQKGLTGIKDARPGPYPMVVTADARTTCDHYDYDVHAAIVPMVSSAGHGKASLKRLHYQEGKFALGTILCAIVPFDDKVISARFIFEYLSAFKEELLVSRMKGTANVSLTINKIGEVPIPMISVDTQEVVHELMALCDQLEAAQKDREERRGRLTAASWQALTTSGTKQATAFALEQLPQLTARPQQIAALRQTILDLAVRGKLVKQDPKDEPAEVLLKRIAKEKERLVKEGKVKKEKASAKDKADAKDFLAVPKGWELVKMEDLTELITKGSSPKWQGVAYVDKESGVLFITSENVGNYRLRKLDELKYVEKKFNDIEPRSILRHGDILVNLVGASIGRAAIYDLYEKANINQAVALIRFLQCEDQISSDFLLHYLNSSIAIEHMLASRVTTAQPNMSLTDVRDFPVPFPPLIEQKRIVAKVDELMRLCDELEATLQQGVELQGKALEALLQLEPATKAIPVMEET